MSEQLQTASGHEPSEGTLDWIKPTIVESSIDEITQLNPFNGTPRPHDSNSLQYS